MPRRSRVSASPVRFRESVETPETGDFRMRDELDAVLDINRYFLRLDELVNALDGP